MVATTKPHQKPSTAETSNMTGVDETNKTGNMDIAAKAMPATWTLVKCLCSITNFEDRLS